MARGRLHYIRINGRYYIYEWSIDELVKRPESRAASFAWEIKPNKRRHRSR